MNKVKNGTHYAVYTVYVDGLAYQLKMFPPRRM